MTFTKTGYRGTLAMRPTHQARTLLATFFLLLPLTPATLAQEISPAVFSEHTMRRVTDQAADRRDQAEDSQRTAGPQWSSGFEFTAAALTYSTAVYSPATNVMVVFAGTDWGMGGADSNAVLLQAPANGNGKWGTLIANGTAGSPPPRWGQTAAYDSANNRMIVFGGRAIGAQYFSDVWVLSNADGQGGTAAWSQLGLSGTSPAPRWGHTAIYDSANNRLTIFGGANASQTFSDVWTLSNANGLGGTPAWTQLSPAGPAPKGVHASSAVYDATSNIMTVFGGENLARNAFTNGVWTLSHANGLGGAPQWTNILADGAAGSPPKRWSHSAVYDITNNRMTIFGGSAFAGASSLSGFGDVWVLANANGQGGSPAWTKLETSGLKPGPRCCQTAVYDTVNNRMMVFGGDNADAIYSVTWVLSHANGL
jgi:hypothetical protein